MITVKMNKKELDAAGAKGVAVATPGSTLIRFEAEFEDGSNERHGWRLRRIKGGGCGNRGEMILVATTARTRVLAKTGWVNNLAESGFRPETLGVVYEACKGHRFGMEPRVIKSVLSNLTVNPLWLKQAANNIPLMRDIMDDTEEDGGKLSGPRLTAVVDIILEVVQG